MTWINNIEHGLSIFLNCFLGATSGHWIWGFLITWIISKCRTFLFIILIVKYINIPFLPPKGVCGRGFNGPYSKSLALKIYILGSYASGKIWARIYPYPLKNIIYPILKVYAWHKVISLSWDGTWFWLWDFDHTSIIVWVMSITRVIVGQTCVPVMDLECNTWEWLWNGSLSWWWIQITLAIDI